MSDQISVQNVMKDEFGWDVPVETVPVPSEGKVYPAGSTLHNRKSLKIRAMTAQEEDILASRALIQEGTVISYLIQSCLTDKKVDVRDMLIGDRNAIMVAVRVTGYGANYAAESTCPECSKKSKQDYNLGELEIKRLQLEPVQPGANLFQFELPITKKVVNFKFLTGADEEERAIIAERKKKFMPDSKVDNLVTSRLEQLIVSISGIEDQNKINHFVKNMPARDSRALRTFIDDQEPGIDMSVWMNCPHCAASSRVSLPVGSNFFWPNE
jgi:hypothetical protein